MSSQRPHKFIKGSNSSSFSNARGLGYCSGRSKNYPVYSAATLASYPGADGYLHWGRRRSRSRLLG